MSSCYIKMVDGPAILRPALLLGDFATGETNGFRIIIGTVVI
jgi:hypothetical protein